MVVLCALAFKCAAQRASVQPALREGEIKGCSLPGLPADNGAPLTAEDLVAAYNARASLVRSLEASLMVRAKGGSEYKTRTRESKESPAMIAFQFPGWLRLTGVVPFTSKRTFDFSSDGREFRLLVPDRNSMRLLIGANDAPEVSTNPRENLRPQPLIDAFTWTPGKLNRDSVSAHPQANGTLRVSLDYAPSVQKTARQAQIEFDLKRGIVKRLEIQDGSMHTITQIDYGDWREWNGGERSEAICFPRHISLIQPRQNIELEMRVIGFTLNPSLTSARFRLPVPPGTPVSRIDDKRAH